MDLSCDGTYIPTMFTNYIIHRLCGGGGVTSEQRTYIMYRYYVVTDRGSRRHGNTERSIIIMIAVRIVLFAWLRLLCASLTERTRVPCPGRRELSILHIIDVRILVWWCSLVHGPLINHIVSTCTIAQRWCDVWCTIRRTRAWRVEKLLLP
jgi:hypothetical protein